MLNFFRKFPLTSYQTDVKDPNAQQVVVDLFRGIKVDIDRIDNANAYHLYEIQDGMRPDQISFELYETPEYFWTFFLINEHLRNGLHNWPKSYSQLTEYANNKYQRKVITPVIVGDGLGEGHLVGLFDLQVGETLSNISGTASAKVEKIDVLLNQIHITMINGTFAASDQLISSASNTVIRNSTQYKYTIVDEINAAHHYIDTSGNVIARIPFSTTDTNTYIPVTNLQYEEDENDKYTSIRVLTPSMVDIFAETYKTVINA
jgi:hypothetical protein